MRVPFLDDIQDALEVFGTMLQRPAILLAHGHLPHKAAPLGKNEVVALDHLAHTVLVQADALERFLVVGIKEGIGEAVGTERLVGKREVASIVEEAVVIGVQVLPSPVLRRQLAVVRVLVRNVLTLVIVLHALEAMIGKRRSHLNGNDQRVVGNDDIVSMASHDDLDC